MDRSTVYTRNPKKNESERLRKNRPVTERVVPRWKPGQYNKTLHEIEWVFVVAHVAGSRVDSGFQAFSMALGVDIVFAAVFVVK